STVPAGSLGILRVSPEIRHPRTTAANPILPAVALEPGADGRGGPDAARLWGTMVSRPLQPALARVRRSRTRRSLRRYTMKSVVMSAVLAIALAGPARADVTIKQTTDGKGLGFSGKSAGTTYIKGSRMRTDVVVGDKTQSMIFDVDGQKL